MYFVVLIDFQYMQSFSFHNKLDWFNSSRRMTNILLFVSLFMFLPFVFTIKYLYTHDSFDLIKDLNIFFVVIFFPFFMFFSCLLISFLC